MTQDTHQPSQTSTAADDQDRLPVTGSRSKQILCKLTVTVLPILYFANVTLFRQNLAWQSGHWGDYASLIVSVEASLLFLPLIAYASFSFLRLLAAPSRVAHHAAVRFGIYMGVALYLQYSILALPIAITGEFSPAAAAIVVWIAMPFLLEWMADRLEVRWRTKHMAWRVFGVSAAAACAALVFGLLSSVLLHGGSLVAFFVIGAVVAPPSWCLYVMLRTASRLFLHRDKRQPIPYRFVGGGLAAFLAAWGYDLFQAARMYTALPESPPTCYVATAATRGHAWVVRSRSVQLLDGRWMQVNRQLQVLKTAELAVQVAWPRLHRRGRAWYDLIGPSLARRIDGPFLADLAYLCLKPFEWSARLMLGLLVPGSAWLAKRLYVGRASE